LDHHTAGVFDIDIHDISKRAPDCISDVVQDHHSRAGIAMREFVSMIPRLGNYLLG